MRDRRADSHTRSQGSRGHLMVTDVKIQYAIGGEKGKRCELEQTKELTSL